MKAVILNGSPQGRGSTVAMLRAIHDELGKRGEIAWFDMHTLAIKPCLGCLKCRPNSECVLPADDAQRVRSAVASADVLVVGTPTYWGNMSAPLKAFFDRNVTLFESFESGWPKAKQKGKSAAIVTSSGSPLPGQGAGAIRSIRLVLQSGGYRIKGSICLPGMSPNKTANPRQIAKAVRIARKLGDAR